MNNLFCKLQSAKWAMEPEFLKTFFVDLANLPHVEKLEDIQVAATPKTYNIINKQAIIKISGVLLKTVPFWLKYFGIDATSYIDIRNQISQAVNDSSVESIHLQVDSPGGIVDGLSDTADAIFAARSAKKLTATIEDLGASAAYWLTSQAETIAAGKTTEVGSIGVYTVYLDSSKRADDLGFKVVLIKSGEHKGMGTPGVEITDKQIEAVQENIDAIAGQFVSAVARGRGKDNEQISKLATGRLWIAGKAKSLGLIDEVVNQNNSTNVQNKGDTNMDGQNKTDEVAVDLEKIKSETAESEKKRMQALKEEFGDDPEYAIKAFTEGKTLEQAKADYCQVLREKLKNAGSKKDSEVETETGAKPVVTGDSDGQAGGDFLTEARELAEEKKISVTQAMKIINRRNPQLHESFRERCRTEGRQMYAEAI